ncbi:MAG TPA: L,D-transpeptidase [Gaiellaceae bacterium]|nr:L,D-transpeptidase [Gaiellaceae bacterium]
MRHVALVTLIATLHHPAAVYRTPTVHAATRQVLPLYTPLSHQRTAVPVLARRGRYLRVLLPGRPNGHSGWIRAGTARVWRTPWRIVVKTESRRLFVLRDGRIVRSFPVVVGKPSTPTPHGRFYVEEAMILPRRALGAPDAYALSARSNVFQEFEGGPGQIAIHGTYRIGGTPGRAESHGCIRASARTLHWLFARMGTGTPVDIR